MSINKLGIALGCAAAVLLSPSAFAERRGTPVTLAEVANRSTATRLTNVTSLLRDDVETELAAIDWTKAGVQKRYVLSASVVRLDSQRVDGALAASCTVSATLRDAERGNILAVVEGRARAEESSTAAARAERDALAGAVRGAITAVPEAIRRAQ